MFTEWKKSCAAADVPLMMETLGNMTLIILELEKTEHAALTGAGAESQGG